MYSFTSPGHVVAKQLFILIVEPIQSSPPPRGAGFVQVRVRVRELTPQLLEQLLQDDH